MRLWKRNSGKVGKYNSPLMHMVLYIYIYIYIVFSNVGYLFIYQDIFSETRSHSPFYEILMKLSCCT